MPINKNIELPSNRKFGFLFTSVFLVLSVYAGYSGSNETRFYSFLFIAAFIGLITVGAPSLLVPFNWAWMKLGELMGRVVSPLVLGFIFFALLTPVSIFTRLFGRDELRLRSKNAVSYWVEREPPGPTGDSFKNQF
jgi:hypothetical protein